MRKKQEYNEEELLIEEIFQAKEALANAETNFNNATDEYFEIANEELTIAQLKLNVLLKKMKIIKE